MCWISINLIEILELDIYQLDMPWIYINTHGTLISIHVDMCWISQLDMCWIFIKLIEFGY
jgi:hypothetical protein